jgi:hypothetical protein
MPYHTGKGAHGGMKKKKKKKAKKTKMKSSRR